MEKACFLVITLPFPLPESWVLLDLHCENLVSFLEVKPVRRWGPPRSDPQKFLTLTLVHSQSPATGQPSHSGFLVAYAPTASAPGQGILAMPLWMHLSLQISRWCLPCDLNSLMAPRKILIFQFVQCIFVVRTGVTSSTFFTYWSWNKKLPSFSFLKDIVTGITILKLTFSLTGLKMSFHCL